MYSGNVGALLAQRGIIKRLPLYARPRPPCPLIDAIECARDACSVDPRGSRGSSDPRARNVAGVSTRSRDKIVARRHVSRSVYVSSGRLVFPKSDPPFRGLSRDLISSEDVGRFIRSRGALSRIALLPAFRHKICRIVVARGLALILMAGKRLFRATAL